MSLRTRQICLGVFFILSLMAISRYGGTVSYSLFYAAVLIPVILLAYIYYVFLRFRVYQEMQTRNIVAGQPVPYSFILKNEGLSVFTSVEVRVYQDFSFVEEMPDKQVFRLFPGDKIEFHTKLTCKYRGDYEVGVEKVIITDFMGVFRFGYRMRSNIGALVRPRIIKLEGLSGVPEVEVFIQSQSVKERNEADLTVREYVKGDSLKKIHWKLTARSGSLKVRNEIGTLKQKIILAADLGRNHEMMNIYLPVENKVLEIVIALLYYFTLYSIPVELLWKAKNTEKRTVSEMKDFTHIYDELSELCFQKYNDPILFFQEMTQRNLLAGGTVLFFVLQVIDESIYTGLSELSVAGKIVLAYIVTEADIADYVRQSSSRLKIVAVGPEEEIIGRI